MSARRSIWLDSITLDLFLTTYLIDREAFGEAEKSELDWIPLIRELTLPTTISPATPCSLYHPLVMLMVSTSTHITSSLHPPSFPTTVWFVPGIFLCCFGLWLWGRDWVHRTNTGVLSVWKVLVDVGIWYWTWGIVLKGVEVVHLLLLELKKDEDGTGERNSQKMKRQSFRSFFYIAQLVSDRFTLRPPEKMTKYFPTWGKKGRVAWNVELGCKSSNRV